MNKRLEIKVNLGAGPSGVNGWINYDWGLLPLMAKLTPARNLLIKLGWLGKEYQVDWPEFVLHDIRKRLPLEDNSVDYIYCSHVLEHFEQFEVKNILRECSRVIKNRGIVRVVVPDIVKMIDIYSKNKDANEFSELVWGFDKESLGQSVIDRLKIGFIRGHKGVYDAKSMKKLLKSVGFRRVKVVTFGQGKVPDIDRLDLIDHERESLYIEASRN